jgi:hypothetical protein
MRACFFPVAGCPLGLLTGGVLLALAGCGSSLAELPRFPDYPPAKVYLEEQDRLKERVQAIQAHEAAQRLQNQIRAIQRADEVWRRMAAWRAQQEREWAFREAIRRLNEERHFRDVLEFQSLQ